MKNVYITKQIKLKLTADQWDLYNMTGRDEVAETLNERVADALNEGRLDKARAVLEAHGKYGANDSESWRTLRHIAELFSG